MREIQNILKIIVSKNLFLKFKKHVENNYNKDSAKSN